MVHHPLLRLHRGGELRMKGVRYWKLLGSDPSGLRVLRSLSTNEISTILDAPAAIKVYPNTVWTMELRGKCCGWDDMAYPVRRITMAGMIFLFGRPFLFLLSQMPRRPAHHQTSPMLVCCRSLC